MQVRGLWQDGQASVSWLRKRDEEGPQTRGNKGFHDEPFLPKKRQIFIPLKSGTHIGQSWVKHEWDRTLPKSDQLRDLEEDSLNFEKVLSDAADRLESCTWIGLKERLNESIELLNYQFPNGIKKNAVMKSTANKLNYEKPGQNVLDKLKENGRKCLIYRKKNSIFRSFRRF